MSLEDLIKGSDATLSQMKRCLLLRASGITRLLCVLSASNSNDHCSDKENGDFVAALGRFHSALESLENAVHVATERVTFEQHLVAQDALVIRVVSSSVSPSERHI